MKTDLDLDLDLSPEQHADFPSEPILFGYSTKHIPICSQKQYIKASINKTESFVKNLRWRTFFFLNPDLERPSKKSYGFNSTKPTLSIPELKDFEDGITLLIENIKFKSTKSNLQCKQKKDLKKIRSDNHLFIPADKTNN